MSNWLTELCNVGIQSSFLSFAPNSKFLRELLVRCKVGAHSVLYKINVFCFLSVLTACQLRFFTARQVLYEIRDLEDPRYLEKLVPGRLPPKKGKVRKFDAHSVLGN